MTIHTITDADDHVLFWDRFEQTFFPDWIYRGANNCCYTRFTPEIILRAGRPHWLNHGPCALAIGCVERMPQGRRMIWQTEEAYLAEPGVGAVELVRQLDALIPALMMEHLL